MADSRCPWCLGDPLYEHYHDKEWGVPVRDDFKLFEMLVLESAQAGLSWLTILRKREAYRRAFDGFDPRRVADYGEDRVETLLADEGIVRNRLKIRSAISNARAFLQVVDEFGSFSDYLWGFVSGNPIINHHGSLDEVPAQTPLSVHLSKDLKKRGFKFVGPVIVYAYMQSVGLVNDHLTTCPRHRQVQGEQGAV